MKYIITTIILCVLALGIMSGCSGKTPANLGMQDGKFAPCPESDNCVSSQATDADHRIEPIKAHGSSDVVMVDIASAIENMFGGKVVKVEDNYLHAVFTSRIFRLPMAKRCRNEKREKWLHRKCLKMYM